MKLEQSINQAEQHLEAIDKQQFDQVAFEWEGIRFKALTEERRDGTYIVRLQAVLGRLFYTIENAAHRALAIESLYLNNRKIDGAYSIDNKGDVHFNSLTVTDQKLHGNDLLVALTTILMQAESHLRTLRSHLKPC